MLKSFKKSSLISGYILTIGFLFSGTSMAYDDTVVIDNGNTICWNGMCTNNVPRPDGRSPFDPRFDKRSHEELVEFANDLWKKYVGGNATRIEDVTADIPLHCVGRGGGLCQHDDVKEEAEYWTAERVQAATEKVLRMPDGSVQRALIGKPTEEEMARAWEEIGPVTTLPALVNKMD